MPKRKRAKTNHPHSKNTANLSQAEIWDDSALIRSWNDAVAEYEVRKEEKRPRVESSRPLELVQLN